MRVRVRVGQSDGQTKTLEVAGQSIRLGRNEECEIAINPVTLPTVSGVHARVEPTSAGFILVHLSRWVAGAEYPRRPEPDPRLALWRRFAPPQPPG